MSILVRNRRIHDRRRRLRDLGRRLAGGARRLGRVLVWAAAITGVVWAAVEAYHTLEHGEHFRLREVQVLGVGPDEVAEVIASCGLEIGQDRLLFRTAETIERTCLENPRIRHARVRLVMPDRAVVEAEMNDISLFAATPAGFWSVNRHAEAWAPADAMDWRSAPVLVGAETLVLDPEEGPSILRDALSLVRTAAVHAGPFDASSVVVQYDRVLGYSLMDLDSGLRARFGAPPFGRKFERLAQALSVAAERGWRVGQVFLDNAQRPEAVTLQRKDVPVEAPQPAGRAVAREVEP